MTSGNQTHKFIDFDFVGLRPGSSFTPVRQLAEAKSGPCLQGSPAQPKSIYFPDLRQPGSKRKIAH